jgi:hypothetical protein
MKISGIQMTLRVTRQHNSTIQRVTTVSISDSDIDIDDNEPCDIEFHPFEDIVEEMDLLNTEFEDLVLLYGPKQVMITVVL